jgi:hypothetical protein
MIAPGTGKIEAYVRLPIPELMWRLTNGSSRTSYSTEGFHRACTGTRKALRARLTDLATLAGRPFDQLVGTRIADASRLRMSETTLLIISAGGLIIADAISTITVKLATGSLFYACSV